MLRVSQMAKETSPCSDLRMQCKELCNLPLKAPVALEVPALPFIMVDSAGAPEKRRTVIRQPMG